MKVKLHLANYRPCDDRDRYADEDVGTYLYDPELRREVEESEARARIVRVSREEAERRNLMLLIVSIITFVVMATLAMCFAGGILR